MQKAIRHGRKEGLSWPSDSFLARIVSYLIIYRSTYIFVARSQVNCHQNGVASGLGGARRWAIDDSARISHSILLEWTVHSGSRIKNNKLCLCQDLKEEVMALMQSHICYP